MISIFKYVSMKLIIDYFKPFSGFLLMLILLVFELNTFAQQKSVIDNFPPVDVLESNCPSEGYFFIASNELVSSEDSNYISIIDNYGTPVFFKIMPGKVTNFKLQPNGYLTFCTGSPKKIFVLDSSYTQIDTITSVDYELNDADFVLTNDNEIFILAYENRLFDMSTIVDGGNPNAIIKESVIQILDNNKQVLFTWKSSDYFNILDVNEDSPFVDLTSPEIDYISLSDIEIDSDSTFLISCKYMDEITKINRNNGEIVWRLGGKRNEFTFINDELGFSQQTSIQKLPNGNLLVFDSGTLHSTQESSIVEYELNELTKTATFIRRIGDKKNIYADQNAGANHLSNGNNIISWGNNKPSLTEFNPNGTVALELDFSDHSFSKQIYKSNWNTNIFTPVVDSINFGMWDYTVFRYILVLKNNSDEIVNINRVTNFSEAFYIEQTLPFQIPANGTKNLIVCYYPEFIQTSIVTDVLTISSDSDTQRIARQVKLVGYRDDFVAPTVEIYPQDEEINVNVDTSFYFKFNEPIRFQDDTEITYENVSDIILLKKDDINGLEIGFDAAISTNKDLITIVPRSKLEYSQTYYIELNGSLEDYYNNALATESNSTFTTSSPSLIQQMDTNEIKFFPNPTSGVFNIESNLNSIVKVEIYNIQGQLFFDYNHLLSKNFNHNLEYLNKGIYICKITLTNGMCYFHKIILQ